MVTGTLRPTGERAPGRELATACLAIGSRSVHDRSFVTHLLIFSAILWGTLSQGAFYRTDLIIFVSVSIAAAVTVPRFRSAVTAAMRWLWLPAIAIVIAVVVSAGVNHQISDVGYAIAPVVAVISLWIAGAAFSGTQDRYLVMRIVVDVAVLTAILGWAGVAFHLHAFAQLQKEGWRAAATIGYANVTGLLLLVGLLCACELAATSGHMSDQVRCWLLATGVLATQSRSVILAMSLCWIMTYFSYRAAARILSSSVAWGLVAFVGLLPSIRGAEADAAVAVVGVAVGLALLLHTSRMTTTKAFRAIVFSLPAAAAVTAIVVLDSRIGDSGSTSGRLRLWHAAVANLHNTGVFGEGPRQLAALSRGQITTRLVHDDPLQYLQYYGVLGLLALLTISWRLSLALVRSRPAVSAEAWTTALTVVTAVAVVALVDFPLQVPLVPAVAGLVTGATLRPVCKRPSDDNLLYSLTAH
jgi:hypothetical protein